MDVRAVSARLVGVVGDSVNDHISWSIRLSRDDAGDRQFAQLERLTHDLLAERFPEHSGYELEGTRLGGPMDGVRWTVTRGSFLARLDVQRFARARSGSDSRTHDLRIIGNAGLGDSRASEPEHLERRVLGWAAASWGLGSIGLGALWLGSQGILSGWTQLLLLLPAAATWRAVVAVFVRRAEQTALPAASTRALSSPSLDDGLARWRELLPVLHAQRERLEDPSGLPFRTSGHTPAQPLAAADAPARLPTPPLELPCP